MGGVTRWVWLDRWEKRAMPVKAIRQGTIRNNRLAKYSKEGVPDVAGANDAGEGGGDITGRVSAFDENSHVTVVWMDNSKRPHNTAVQ
jgi:hypothetical protein